MRRPLGFYVQQSVTPPAILYDGNTLAWYDSQDLTTITKDAGTGEVTRWNDKLLSGHDLLDPGATKRPVWSANGVSFDGSNDYMQTAGFSVNNPHIYIVFKQITWTSADRIFDGVNDGKGSLLQSTASPGLTLYTVSVLPVDYDLAIGVKGIARCLFNTINSKLTINENAPVTGSLSPAALGGITLGGRGTHASLFANVEISEVIYRSIIDSAPNDALIYAYMKNHNLVP